MSYRPYATPQSGYQPAPRTGYATPPATPWMADGKEGTFSELLVTDGVGDFHINHFIGYSSQAVFTAKIRARCDELQTAFYEDFADTFSTENVAVANIGKYLHEGKKTIEFEIGGNDTSSVQWYMIRHAMGWGHSDWVSLQRHIGSGSFYASTLKREWPTALEKGLLKALKTTSSPVDDALAEVALDNNRHHFLAGRRSFKVGYDQQLQRFYVETATLERSSTAIYDEFEKSGTFRPMIIQIWTHLVENFEKKYDGGPDIYWLPSGTAGPEHVPEGYTVQGNVAYRVCQTKTISGALDLPWFKSVADRHPGLTIGLDL